MFFTLINNLFNLFNKKVNVLKTLLLFSKETSILSLITRSNSLSRFLLFIENH